MSEMFVFLLLLFFLPSCTQESAKIIYRNESPNNYEKSIVKPEYIKGSYIKTKDDKIVRDLRKNNKYNENERKRVKIENDNRIIIVKNGDSLLKIAREYGCSLNEIAELNRIKSPYNVYPKQKILINCGKYRKVKQNIDDETKEYKTVIVEKGFSLTKLALDNNSNVIELAKINSIEPPYNLYIGQKIKVPLRYNNYILNYIVKKGDNLYSIAKENNINFTDLISYNNLKKPYDIYVGQKLYLQKSSEKQKSKNNKYKEELERVEIENSQTSKIESKIELDQKKDKNNGIFLWPVKGQVIKNFGKQENGNFNDAINIKVDLGTEIKAAESGEIAYAGNELKGFGNIIIIKHKNGWLTIYGHCDSITIKVKDKVQKGQTIGKVGKTGNVDEPQLYFSLRKGRTAMDPIKYLTN